MIHKSNNNNKTNNFFIMTALLSLQYLNNNSKISNKCKDSK